MSDVSVIGLGAMGSALARCLLATRSVTVWNRTPARAGPLCDAGAALAASAAEALAASPVSLICVSDYAAGDALLKGAELSGRIIVQLTTGTPGEAARGAETLRAAGALCLDGVILCYPDGIGTADAAILVAGDAEAWDATAPLLRALAGASRYLGENVRGPAALDLAWLSRLEGVIMGTLHGARICEAEGIPLSELIPLMPEGDRARSLLTTIERGDFAAGPGAGTVRVAAGVVARLQDQAREAGLAAEFPDLMMAWFERAIAAGAGDEDTAAAIKALRTRGAAQS